MKPRVSWVSWICVNCCQIKKVNKHNISHYLLTSMFKIYDSHKKISVLLLLFNLFIPPYTISHLCNYSKFPVATTRRLPRHGTGLSITFERRQQNRRGTVSHSLHFSLLLFLIKITLSTEKEIVRGTHYTLAKQIYIIFTQLF